MLSLLYTVLVLAPLILCAVSLLVLSVRFAASEPGEPRDEPLPDGVATKGCPDCAETVLEAARVCRHCRFCFTGERDVLAA